MTTSLPRGMNPLSAPYTGWCKINVPCLKIPAPSAARKSDLPCTAQSANFAKFWLNSLNLAPFLLLNPTEPQVFCIKIFVDSQARAQTERGNTRGGATKKREISRTLLSINLHFSVLCLRGWSRASHRQHGINLLHISLSGKEIRVQRK